MIVKKSIVGLISALTLASCTAPGATPETTTPVAPTPAVPTTSAPQSGITKTQNLSYKSPAGDETISVSITTKDDGTITTVSATPEATNEISLKLQKAFTEGVSEKVVGKSIKNLKVDTISGASLTTKAFNDFLVTLQ